MNKQENTQSVKVEENDKYINYVPKPFNWKCGVESAPPIHKIALKNREARLKKEAEKHG